MEKRLLTYIRYQQQTKYSLILKKIAWITNNVSIAIL